MDEIDKLVEKRAMVYDTRIKSAMREDPILQTQISGDEYRAFMNLLSWTVNQVSDGYFTREQTVLVPHLTAERLDRFLAVGIVDDHGDRLRIAHKYQSWQSSTEELRAQAKKQLDGNARQRRHREAQQRPAQPDAEVSAPSDRVAGLVDAVEGNLPAPVRAKLAEQVSALIADGITDEKIADALQRWQDDDKAPGYLPYLVRSGGGSSGIRAALEQARKTWDMSPLLDYGYRWQPPDAPPKIGPQKVREFMQAEKTRWLNNIEQELA